MGVLRHVTIIVGVNGIQVVPDPIHVSKKDTGQVCWHCPQGEAEITFADSPFYSDKFVAPRSGSVCSGPVVNRKECGDYKYSIIVRIPGDKRDYQVDPTVIVDD